MRWDAIDERRYALSATDPFHDAARTVWMANLLGYRAQAKQCESCPSNKG